MRCLPSTSLKAAVLVATVGLATASFAVDSTDSAFTAAPNGAVSSRFPYYPIKLDLSDKKPAEIVKEPAYRAKPLYGVIRLGDGPKSATYFAVDQPTEGDWKIYVDFNHDGNLTGHGDGSWNHKTESSGRTMYGVKYLTLRASYGTKTHERSSSPYTVGLYTFSNMGPFMYRATSRNGMVVLDGKPHAAMLVENDADGVFSKPVETIDQAKTTKPIWMRIDLKDDGKFSSGTLDVRGPFKLGDKTYEARISDDGFRVGLTPTSKVALDLTPKQVDPIPLLKRGAAAPEFVAEKWGGGDLKLSDYRGKIVVLDFWATWCGPCQKSMPHIESLHQQLQSRDVAVVGICVWDDKKAYEDWVPKNQSKYTFQLAFDPAGKANDKSIATKLFNVSGIPTTYLIDKDGNVADAIVGYDDGDKRLEAALRKLGVAVN